MEPQVSYQRYHVPIAPAPDRAGHPSRFKVTVDRPGLARLLLSEVVHYRGWMPVVLSRPCVYGVFSGPVGGFAPRSERCVGCLRCTVQYPDFVRVEPNPERLHLGDEYISPDMVDGLLYEAATGRVPVRGAGYRGAFSGGGWDRMWTDMSEIVRPTRDGIHGREFISTSVDLGPRPRFLAPGSDPAELPRWRSIQLPFVLDRLPHSVEGVELYRTLAEAARRLDTLAIVPWDHLDPGRVPAHVVPLIRPEHVDGVLAGRAPSVVELDGWDGTAFARLRGAAEIVAVRTGFEADPVMLVERGVSILHYVADYHGGTPSGFVQQAMLRVHQALVSAGRREEVSLLLSGGISAAEHLPKAIISGADAVALDLPLVVALQARLLGPCLTPEQAKLDLPSTPGDWRVQRIVNLAGSWRDQLLEVLGAMGLREVRRLRGEVGRAMFADEMEREAFAGIAGYPG